MGARSKALIDLPLMTDPELQAAMKVLSALLTAAHFTDPRLYLLADACRMVTISVQHGTSGDSASAYGSLGARCWRRLSPLR